MDENQKGNRLVVLNKVALADEQLEHLITALQKSGLPHVKYKIILGLAKAARDLINCVGAMVDMETPR